MFTCTRGAVHIDRAPQPKLLTPDRDHDFIEVPFITRPGAIPFDAAGKMSAKAIDPEPDSLPTDYNAALSQQVLNIRGAQGKAVIRPNGVGDDLTGKTEASQARYLCWSFHDIAIHWRNKANNLPMLFSWEGHSPKPSKDFG